MSETSERIEQLLAEGLRLYGEDRVDEAARHWTEVLELEPGHAEAREYLEAAGFLDPAGAEPEEEAVVIATPGDGHEETVWEALGLYRRGEGAEALSLLESLTQQDPHRLEAQAYMELLRSHLFREYLAELADGKAVLSVRVGPEEMMKYNLPANAGFLLSRIDGSTTAAEILTLAATDPFEAVFTLHRLVEANLVEVTS